MAPTSIEIDSVSEKEVVVICEVKKVRNEEYLHLRTTFGYTYKTKTISTKTNIKCSRYKYVC